MVTTYFFFFSYGQNLQNEQIVTKSGISGWSVWVELP